jgi:isochorismate synthase EntC
MNPARRMSFKNTEHAFSLFLKHGSLLAIGAKGAIGEQQFLIGWGASQEVDELSIDCTFINPDFYLESDTWYRTTAHWDIVSKDVLKQHLRAFFLAGSGLEVNAENPQFHWSEPSYGDFVKSLQTIREGFEKRGLKKAVPVVHARSTAEWKIAQNARSLSELLDLPETSMPYGHWQSDESGALTGILGASPELLWDGGGTLEGLTEIQTVALAGTVARPGGSDVNSLSRQLLDDSKEREEHQLVIDDLQETLADLGRVQTDVTAALVLPHLIHLKTDIHVEFILPIKPKELIRRIHPTPALGVAPRVAGFKEMRLWDDAAQRGDFGAPFGAFWTDESGETRSRCVVAIRCVRFKRGELLLSAGCGVIFRSVAEREWQELANKRASVRKMLRI